MANPMTWSSFGDMTDEYDRDDRCGFEECRRCGSDTGSLAHNGTRICHECEIWGFVNPHDVIVPWDARELVDVLEEHVENPKEMIRNDREQAETLANEQIGL